MKLRSLSTVIAAGAAVVAVSSAPTAAAAEQTCTYIGAETTTCQSPGNVQIDTDHEVQYPYLLPFYGNALLFHHGGNHR